jgi:patatin-related protein
MTNDGAAAAKTELRLALVCYGGVSLAVYMHGITKELHKLIWAARAFDNDPDHNPFPDRHTEHVYFEALRSMAGPKLSVSIDIIGGTSAGGINGIALGKALACNVDMEPLKDVWLNKGDIRQLLRGPSKMPLGLQVGLTIGLQLLTAFGNSSPLKGEYMSMLLFNALKSMQDRKLPFVESLLPAGETAALELYIPTTDLAGFEVLVASGAGGASNRDRDFRQVMVFRQDASGKDTLEEFGDSHTADLAFAGRASSSFPGAFAPVSPASFITEVKKMLPKTPDADLTIHPKPLFLRPYGSHEIAIQMNDHAAAEDAWEEAKDVYFVDGGVLDNAPFDLVIDAIARRPAQAQVHRRLIYVEPDPGQALYEPIKTGTKSGRSWLKDLVAVSGVRGSHPILTDLMRLRDLNSRITEVRVISEQQESFVTQQTREELAHAWNAKGGNKTLHVATTTEYMQDMSHEDLQTVSNKLYDRAEESLKPMWPTYLLLRLEAVLKQLAADICWTLQCPKPSNQAAFITEVLIEWARCNYADAGDWTSLRKLLDGTDMLYRQRRLTFIINGINGLYDGDAAPPRADLNALKTKAWAIMDHIRAGTAEAVGALKAQGTLNFLNLSDDEAVKNVPSCFVKDHRDELQALFELYTQNVQSLTDDSIKLQAAFAEHTQDPRWTDDAKTALVSRYLAFPFWDGMLFPTISLTDIPAFTPIPVAQFSPINATLLKPPVEKSRWKWWVKETKPVKLKGIPVKHFAAFFATKSRQNDYLWGRLDGAELILKMLAEVGQSQEGSQSPECDDNQAPPPPFAREAFEAVLASEHDLKLVKDLRKDLQRQVDEMPRTPAAGTASVRPSLS